MEFNDATTPDSSPEPEAAPVQETRPDLEALSPEEYDTWLQKGTLPVKDSPKKEASATSNDDPVESPEPSAGDDEHKEGTIPDHKPKRGAESRKQELAAEIQSLLKQRAELRREIETSGKGERKAEPPPAPKEAKPEVKPEVKAPVKPKLDDFETYEEFDAARETYFEQLTEFKAREAVRIEREAREAAETEMRERDSKAKVAESWNQKVTDAKDRYEDFETVAFSDKVPLNQAAMDFVLNSDAGADVLYKLGKNPTEAARIASLDAMGTMRELARIELSLSGTRQPTTQPTTKKITGAKPPPKDIGGYAKTGDDEVVSALKAGDAGRYIELMNQRDAARLVRR